MKKIIKNQAEKVSEITISQLKKMATSEKLRDIFKKHIEHEEIPCVRAAWIEYFLDLKNKKNSIKCKSNF